MASSALVGALRATLGLDTAAFESGSKRAESRLDKLGKAFRAAGITAAVAAIPAALGVAIKSTINFADNMGKMAQKIGIPVEQLSQLKHVADLADVSLESLGIGVRKLSQNMVQVAQGATNDAAKAFRDLGISVRNADGSLKSTSQLLPELAGAFAAMPDGVRKTALAVALLGRSGTDLIPLLNAGSAGLREMMTEADQLGLTITSNTAAASERFNDNLTRLGAVMQGITTQITVALLPSLDSLLQRFTDWATKSGFAETASNAVVQVVQYLSEQLIILETRISNVTRTLGILTELWNVNLLDTTKVAEIWGRLTANADANAAAFRRMNIEIAEMWSGKGGGLPPAQAATQVANSMDVIAEKTKKATFAFGHYREVSGAALVETQTLADRLKDQFSNFNDTLADTFVSAISGTQSLKDAFRDLISDMLQQAAKLFLSQAFQSIFASAFGGAPILAGVGAGGMGFGHFGGPRAGGGHVNAGTAYSVGERGREMFVPHTSGDIVPNDELGGVDINVQVINTNGSNVRTESNGRNLRVIVEDAVATTLADPTSRANRVLQQRGAGPTMKRR